MQYFLFLEKIMKTEDPILYELKLKTVEIISQLATTHQVPFSTATELFYIIAKKKKLNCGFKVSTCRNFYHSVKNFQLKKT